MESKSLEKILEEKASEFNIKDIDGVVLVSEVQKKSAESSAQVDLSDDDIDVIVRRIASAMNRIANLGYKGSTFIEPGEVEQLKKDVFRNENIEYGLKIELEAELTKFQQEITTHYKEAIKEYTSKIKYCETQIRVIEMSKKEIISKRLSKMLWPFDANTKACDNKIAAFKIQASRYTQKLADIEQMRPAANEKDIVMFQLKLKEKFKS